MRITVIGAAGGLGREVVRTAADRGHTVVGLARHRSQLEGISGMAMAVPGDARHPAALARAIAGSDAVVSTIPGGNRRDPHGARDAVASLTEVMSEHGVRRLVVASAYPLVATRPRLALAVLRTLFATAYADARDVENLARASQLDWTIVRLNRLSDGDPVGYPVISGGLLDRASGLTRADAAALFVDLAEGRSHVREAVNVSGARTS